MGGGERKGRKGGGKGIGRELVKKKMRFRCFVLLSRSRDSYTQNMRETPCLRLVGTEYFFAISGLCTM